MACRLVGLSRSAYRRPLKGDTVADPDRAFREWLRAWAKDHPRYGYRRAYHDARAEGWVVNHKKIQRLWRDEGLRVPQRRRRKRVGSSTVDAPTADAPNVVWAVDFQFDADEHGRPIKICSIVDEHTRECIGGLVERSITADRLTAHLEDLVAARGAPAVLRSDNGPEFISEAMADWAGTRTGLSYIPPGSPWRNGYVESFNSRIRDECLNINSFYSLLHAQVIIGDWKDEYNHHRRHSSLGYLTPAEYARQCTHQMETDDSQNVRTERRGRLSGALDLGALGGAACDWRPRRCRLHDTGARGCRNRGVVGEPQDRGGGRSHRGCASARGAQVQSAPAGATGDLRSERPPRRMRRGPLRPAHDLVRGAGFRRRRASG